jgi:hypothetical protein
MLYEEPSAKLVNTPAYRRYGDNNTEMQGEGALPLALSSKAAPPNTRVNLPSESYRPDPEDRSVGPCQAQSMID